MTICKYCSEEVEIPFEEQKDKRKRTIFKGKCPKCNRINIKYPKRPPEPEIPELPPVSVDIDRIPLDDSTVYEGPGIEQEPPAPEDLELIEDSEPEEEEEVIKPESQELLDTIEEGEKKLEAEWEKAKRRYQIMMIVMVGIILCLVGVSIWLYTRQLEKTERKTEEVIYGSEKTSMD